MYIHDIYIYTYIMSDVSGSHDTLKRHPSRIGNQKPIRDVHGVKAVEAKPGAAACHLIMA